MGARAAAVPARNTDIAGHAGPTAASRRIIAVLCILSADGLNGRNS